MAKGNSKPFGKSGSTKGTSGAGGLKPNAFDKGGHGNGSGGGGNGVKPKPIKKGDIGKVF